jgi:nucleoside-diphosphate-sugar epimerase
MMNMETKGSTVLVTGATTPLGRKVCRSLIDKGNTVRAVLRDDPKTSNEWHRLPTGVVPYVVDLTLKDKKQEETLRQACAGASSIFHIASASYSAQTTYDHLIDINVIGTENVIKAWLDANPSPAKGRIIFTSSASVYGHSRPGELLNENSKLKPDGPYALSKYMAAHVIESWCSANPRLSYTIARLGVFYGEGYEAYAFKIYELLMEDRMSYLSKGLNHLALIHVDDAVDALMRIYDNAEVSANKTYNITDGIAYTQKEFLDTAVRLLNAKQISRSTHPLLVGFLAKKNSMEYQQHEFINSDRMVSIDLARKELGFKPSRNYESESKVMVEQFMSERAKSAHAEHK